MATSNHEESRRRRESFDSVADYYNVYRSPYPNVHVETSSFEAWPRPRQQFDAVVSASAFHWLDPAVRFSKCAQALRPGGCLTILHVHHVRGGTPGFFADTQPYYLKWGLSDDLSFQPPAPEDVPTLYPELDQRPEFRCVERHHVEIPRRHSTASYIGWLRTDSLVNSLTDQARRGFLQDIERLIAAQYNGEVVRNYVYAVIVAQRAW